MTQDLKEEFNQYLKEISEENDDSFLTGFLADYTILACMQDNPQKKTFLLENEKGQKILCKYAGGNYKKMLETENELAASQNFSFFPYVIDYLETEEEAIFLRRYIEGRTLSEMVDEDGPLKLEDALAIIRNICLCLMQLHDATPALIHRDIKPSNIVLNKSGKCYLVDMGTLRQYQEGEDSDTFCMGTAEFAAPEQFGVRQTDVRTDIYGLGLLFYYLLTGKNKIQKEDFAQMPRKVSSFIRKCTAFNPDDRYDNIHQVYRELTGGFERKKGSVLGGIGVSVLAVLAVALLLNLISPKINFGNPRVRFSSPLLEQAVRQELNKKENEPVRRKDLKKIHRLEICGTEVLNAGNDHGFLHIPHRVDEVPVEQGDISDISLLAEMPNLNQLILDYQEISDITPLEGLPLITVSLVGNPLGDLTPISDCKDLYEVDVSYTKVLSLEPLAECSKLQILRITDTPVNDLSPLADLNLVRVNMRDTAIRDFGPLENMPLEYLECGYASESNLEQIKKIETLRELNVYKSNIKDLECFEGMEQLYILGLAFNSLESLDGIENMPNLSYLNIGNNPITECPSLPQLKNMDIAYTAIRDFSFINDMPALRSLFVSESQRTSLEKQIPEPWFDVVYE